MMKHETYKYGIQYALAGLVPAGCDRARGAYALKNHLTCGDYTPHMNSAREKQGFTLIELSVVLVVIAIITAMGVSSGVDALEASRRISTESKMDVIESALLAYRKKHGRLPCPADAQLLHTDASYGIEAENMSGTCTGGTPEATYVTLGAPMGVPSGAVPVRTLSLPDSFMYDGWNKKIHYEVTPTLTIASAFAASQLYDSCSITIKDNSDTALTTNAVYALVSYGKNGIGSYGLGGTQYTGANAGDDEDTNIRTTTNTPTIRVRNTSGATVGSSGYYDDIVRFKSRYQMMDANDRSTPIYKGPELVMTYATSSAIQTIYGKKKCGVFEPFSGTVPGVVGDVPRFAAFTPGNTNLFMYHTDNCNFYSITSSTIAAVTESTPVPNCPADSTSGAMAQSSGAIALNLSTSPYVQVYTQSGTGASAKYSEITNALVPALPSAPTSLSFSANGELLTVARSQTYAKIFVRNDDGTYHDRGAMPGDIYNEYTTAISPNGKYYAIAVEDAGNARVYIWRNINGVFSQMTISGSPMMYVVSGMTAPNVLVFSPDSTYLAIAGASLGPSLAVLNINPVTEVVAEAASIVLSTTPTSVAFSRDANFMAVARGTTNTDSLAIYRRRDTFSYTLDPVSTAFGFNNSVNSNYIALSR